MSVFSERTSFLARISWLVLGLGINLGLGLVLLVGWRP